MRTIVADGIEFEVVWDGAKDGPSLLPADYPAIDGRRECGYVDGPSSGPVDVDGAAFGFVIPGLRGDTPTRYAVCGYCGQRFTPKRAEQQFCDRDCKQAAQRWTGRAA